MFPYMMAEDKETYKTASEYVIKYFAAQDPFKMSENSGAIFDFV
jgi:hypothetical protein